MKSFTAAQNDAGQRIDKFLEKAVPALPKSLMYKYIRLKRIKVNKKRCTISQLLNKGDTIELYINDEFFPITDSGPQFLLAPNTVDVVFEDQNILIVNKKSGLVVHEDESQTPDTLINRVLHYLYDKGEYDPESELSFTPALCNRLDRNTSGIVICAKNAEALRVLNQKIKDRELSKFYLCITCKIPKETEAVKTAYLTKDEKAKTVSVSDRKTPQSKTAVTKYKVLKTSGSLALCEVELITGRTHQIRAHMAYLGAPVLGDGKYGSHEINNRYRVKAQALHAYKLRFGFKTDGGILSYLDGREFQTPPPWFQDKFFGEK